MSGNKEREIRDVSKMIFAFLFLLIGVILFIGSSISYFLSQGMPGEIWPDYMGGIIVENELSAYSTIVFITGFVCFGVAKFFWEL